MHPTADALAMSPSPISIRASSKPTAKQTISSAAVAASRQRRDVLVGAGQVGQRAGRRPRQHQREQQQYDDGAQVDQHLHPGDELRRQQQVAAGQRAERDDQPQRAVHQVAAAPRRAAPSRPRSRRAARTAPRRSSRVVLRRWLHAARPPSRLPRSPSGQARAGRAAAGGGTVHIHSRSRSFSWVSSRMSNSAYSNSGDQCSASNGHTSMQMPQYMQSEKSMREAVEHVVAALASAGGRRRRRLLVRVDVDAPRRALARAQHADRAVLLHQRDHAARARRQLRQRVGIVRGDRAAGQVAQRHDEAGEQSTREHQPRHPHHSDGRDARAGAARAGTRPVQASFCSWSSRRRG